MSQVPASQANAVIVLMQATDDTKAKAALHSLYNDADKAALPGKSIFHAVCAVAAADYSAEAIEAARKELFPNGVPAAPETKSHKPGEKPKPAPKTGTKHAAATDDADDDDTDDEDDDAPKHAKKTVKHGKSQA